MKRRLEEFGPLSPAERKLRDEICDGQFVILGDGSRPGEAAGPDRQVRAEFLRYLILGGCDALPGVIPENGVRVAGALITDTLDLEGARIPRDVVLTNCRFATIPNLMSAQIDTLVLSGSALPGLVADRLRARGNVFLSNAKTTGEIRLLGADLGGNLACDGARFTAGESGKALNADGLRANGSVFLSNAVATGEIRLLGADLGGDLACAGAEFTAGESGRSLNAAGATIAGTFFLRGKARVDGALDLTATRIGTINDDAACWPKQGNLILNRCRYGAFTGGPVTATARIRWLGLQDPARWGADFWPQPWEECARVLREMGHGEAARRILIDKERKQRQWQRDKLKARLLGAQLRCRLEQREQEDLEALNADIQSAWQAHTGPMQLELAAQLELATHFREHALGKLVTDRAAFEAVLAPRMTRTKIAGFDPVMNARGAIFETRARLVFLGCVDAMLSGTIAYGHRPLRALVWLAGLWLFGALLFGMAAGQDAIKPNNAFVLRSAEWVACAPGYVAEEGDPALRNAGTSQLACFRGQPEAASYPAFNALVYSADTLLPIVALEMQEFWIPDETQGTRGRAARVFLWVQIMLGWALSLLAVAGFSGLVRSD